MAGLTLLDQLCKVLNRRRFAARQPEADFKRIRRLRLVGNFLAESFITTGEAKTMDHKIDEEYKCSRLKLTESDLVKIIMISSQFASHGEIKNRSSCT